MEEPSPTLKRMEFSETIPLDTARKTEVNAAAEDNADYSRPTPSIDVSKDVSDEQKEIWKSNSASFSEQGGSVGNVVSKPMIRFVKETGCPSVSKVNNTEKSRKPTVKYAENVQYTWEIKCSIDEDHFSSSGCTDDREHEQMVQVEFDVEITTVGAEVDDIAAET
ncbi:hypothetical protein Tco_1116055 [Tanacetum coccineum]